MAGRYDSEMMIDGLKRAVSGLIPASIKNHLRETIVKALDFDLVSSWLNQATRSSSSYSLIFENGETWLVMKNGMKMKYTSALNSVSSIVMKYGSFEEVELRLCLSNLTNDSVFFDVGANVGFYSIAVAMQFPSARVHAFEPVVSTASAFRQNLAKNELDDRIVVLNELALSDADGEAYMTSDFHSSNYITTSESKYNKTLIRCTTIDRYVRDNSVDSLNLIKIDVEGHELKVAKGAEETLMGFRPKVLVELNKREFEFYDRRVTDDAEFIDFMSELGYRYCVIDDNDRVVSMNDIDSAKLERPWHNYLFHHADAVIANADHQDYFG